VEDTGTGAIGDNRLLHEKFVELGVPHVWREQAGTHSWDYWGGHLNEHLVFHQAAMIDETPGFSKWQRHWYERVCTFHDENAQATLSPRPRPVLVLLGPSTMEALKSEYFPDFHVVNRGIIAEGVGVAGRGTAWRLEESVFDVRPDVVVYSDATNDLGDLARNGSPALEAVAERYELNVAAIRQRLPETRVILLTCGPARDRYAIINEHVVAFNALLPAIAERQGCLLLNTHELLVGEDGLLREDFTGDGLHLSETGTAVFVERINEGLRKHMTK
jgi:lysophospholipase L1-like esterase